MTDSVTYAKLVSAAYDWVRPANYTVLNDLPNEMGWVLLDPESDDVIIVVRGTETREDVFADLDLELIQTQWGHVHKGFWGDTMLLIDSVKAGLAKAPANSRLVLAGHSLGAAIVTIMAVILHYDYKPSDMLVYSLASPRVGMHNFSFNYMRLKIKTKRFVNKHDVVPCLPNGFGYRHVCDDIEFEDGTIGTPLYNHHISTYIQNVGQFPL